MTPTEYAKAIVGALIAALTALGTAVADGGISTAEWVGIPLAGLVAFAAVWGTPNRPRSRRPGGQQPQLPE